MEKDISRPFSRNYVIKVTREHMLRSIDISINKTFARVEEFADDLEKSQEVFATLAELHSMRKAISERIM